MARPRRNSQFGRQRQNWLALGTVRLEAGSEDRWMRLGDNYDDAADNGRTLVFDAIRVGTHTSDDPSETDARSDTGPARSTPGGGDADAANGLGLCSCGTGRLSASGGMLALVASIAMGRRRSSRSRSAPQRRSATTTGRQAPSPARTG